MSELQKIISAGEGLRMDFKQQVEDQRKIARTLVAFANCEGGSLLIGVKDNHKISGVNPEEELHMIQGAADLYCYPKVKFDYQIWQEEMKLVLEVRVSKDHSQLYKALDDQGKRRVFLRIEDHTLKANKVIENGIRLKRRNVERPVVVSDQYLSLLSWISQLESPITLSAIYENYSKLKMKEIDESLALCLAWGLLEFVYDGSGFKFRPVN